MDLLKALRKALEELTEIRVAWIEQSPAKYGEPLCVALLAPGRPLSSLVSEAQRRYSEIEREFDITIEVHGYTRADAPPTDWDTVVLLAGAPHNPPAPRSTGSSTHQEKDDRAKRFAESVSKLLDNDPSLVRRTMQHVERLLMDDQGTAEHDLREWRDILGSYSLRRLQDFLVSSSSCATCDVADDDEVPLTGGGRGLRRIPPCDLIWLR